MSRLIAPSCLTLKMEFTNGGRAMTRVRGYARIVLLILLLGAASRVVPIMAAAENKGNVPTDRPMSYAAFDAVGDGVVDDLPAIDAGYATITKSTVHRIDVRLLEPRGRDLHEHCEPHEGRQGIQRLIAE
jgi:hypothetical protein